jgi:hypothetical protein
VFFRAQRATGHKTLILAVFAFLVADITAAQLAKRLWPRWDLAALDLSYRVPHPVYHHDLAPKREAIAAWGALLYPIRTNALGFRDASMRDVPLRTAQHRILVMGDSATEGVGIPYESTFVGIMGESLSSQRVELLNAAVCSYSPSIYYRKTKFLLEDVGLAFDEVLVLVDISDIGDEAELFTLDSNDRVVLARAELPDWMRLVVNNRGDTTVAQRLKHALETNSVVAHGLTTLRALSVDGERRRTAEHHQLFNERGLWTTGKRAGNGYGARGMAQAQERMDRLARLLTSRSIPLTLVVYPWPYQILSGDRNSIQVSSWRAWSERSGVAFVDLFPPFFREADRGAVIRRNFIDGDVHFSAAGHQLMARELLARFHATGHGPRQPALAPGLLHPNDLPGEVVDRRWVRE